jgi:hypothetical protein
MEATMAAPQVTGKKITTRQRRDLSGVPAAAYSVQEFCDAHRISRSKYYEMRAKGLTPAEMEVDGSKRISTEAAERWRAEREAAANTSAT